MRLAFALYKYFPYGGLARDFLRVAELCLTKGHSVDVYVMDWQGDIPNGFNMHIVKAEGWTNHARVTNFHRQIGETLANNVFDVTVGFNKIPSVDVYYAADPCYIDRFVDKTWLAKLNPRYRVYAAAEKAVFGLDSKTICLMISEPQTALFKKHYQISDERLVMLPPGIDPNRRRPEGADEKRMQYRQQLKLENNDLMLLMVGSAFKTKGVDRAIDALASLPEILLEKTQLMIVGEGDIKAYRRYAKDKGVTDHCHFMGGRSDVPDFLLAADLLLHPARKENTGTVILEAMISGLPQLVTGVCGYAKHVRQADSGRVIEEPFQQQQLNRVLLEMLTGDERQHWAGNALNYAQHEDLYSMPEKVVDVIEQVGKGQLDET
jgi:UDP-glucose:(heptosyl)LPS alpha-1,3-glucosyltransferase